jgi:transcriptional regulator with XRE-family HTH domain
MSGTVQQFVQSGDRLVKVKSFGEALRLFRTQGKSGNGEGLSHRDLADFCGVSKADVKSWEEGKTLPEKLPMKKLLIILPKLRYFAQSMTKVEVEPIHDGVFKPDPEPEIKAPEPPKTFGEAFKRSRLAAGVDRGEVAVILWGTDGTMSGLEEATIAQIENDSVEGGLKPKTYEDILELFPELKAAPMPRLAISRETAKADVVADAAMSLAAALVKKKRAIDAYEGGRHEHNAEFDKLVEFVVLAQGRKAEAERELLKTTVAAFEAQAALNKVIGIDGDPSLVSDLRNAKKALEKGVRVQSADELRRSCKEFIRGIMEAGK